MTINIYDTCVISYNGNEYWVLAPMNDIMLLSKNWSFLKLPTLSIIQLSDVGKIEKEELWFNSNEIKAITTFPATELDSQELSNLLNYDLYINELDSHNNGEKTW